MSTEAAPDYVCEECGHTIPAQYVCRFILNGKVICPYCGATMVKVDEQ
jgi:uncharacterized Zn finger protein (UPF0148 family)